MHPWHSYNGVQRLMTLLNTHLPNHVAQEAVNEGPPAKFTSHFIGARPCPCVLSKTGKAKTLHSLALAEKIIPDITESNNFTYSEMGPSVYKEPLPKVTKPLYSGYGWTARFLYSEAGAWVVVTNLGIRVNP